MDESALLTAPAIPPLPLCRGDSTQSRVGIRHHAFAHHHVPVVFQASSCRALSYTEGQCSDVGEKNCGPIARRGHELKCAKAPQGSLPQNKKHRMPSDHTRMNK